EQIALLHALALFEVHRHQLSVDACTHRYGGERYDGSDTGEVDAEILLLRSRSDDRYTGVALASFASLRIPALVSVMAAKRHRHECGAECRRDGSRGQKFQMHVCSLSEESVAERHRGGRPNERPENSISPCNAVPPTFETVDLGHVHAR